MTVSVAALRACVIVCVAALVVWLTACMASAVALLEQLAGVGGVGLDRAGELLHARVEHVGGGLGADLDLLGDVLGAADQQLLEAADAGVEGVGDFEARVPSDLSMSSICAPIVSASLAPRVLMTPVTSLDALVERGDDLLAAFGQRLGDVHDARGEGVVERLGAAVERLLEARQALVEGRGDFGRLGADLGVEAVDVVAHRGRDFLVRWPRRSTSSPP